MYSGENDTAGYRIDSVENKTCNKLFGTSVCLNFSLFKSSTYLDRRALIGFSMLGLSALGEKVNFTKATFANSHIRQQTNAGVR